MLWAILSRAGMLNRVAVEPKRSVTWKFPRQSDREKARRRRQIERGIIAPNQVMR